MMPIMTATEFIEHFPEHQDIKPYDTKIREKRDFDHVFLFPIFEYQHRFYAPPIMIDKHDNRDLANMAVYWLFTHKRLDTEPHYLDIVNFPVYKSVEHAWPDTVTQILIPHAWRQVLKD